MTPLDQARAYVATIPGAVSGQGGHDETFRVASLLVNGYALPMGDARRLMDEFNARCQPPWSERELEHKLETAAAQGGHMTAEGMKPRGSMLSKRGVRAKFKHPSGSAPIPPTATPSAPAEKPKANAPRYTLSASVALPEPIVDGAAALLKAAFQRGEGVRIAQAMSGEDGRELPKDAGTVLSREQWLEKLAKHGGDPNKFLRTSDRNGIFISLNPMKVHGKSDADVTAYRHALLEFDRIPSINEQWDLIQQSKIPCSAVIFSGGKSLHAWVKVDAKDRAEYDARVKILYAHFDQHIAEGDRVKGNKNPSRFSRLANCERGKKRQELMAIGCGAESWEAWSGQQEASSGLPPIRRVQDFIEDDLPIPSELISGLLHQGSKMVLGGGSKSYKTFSLLDLALAVSCGRSWWNRSTSKGRVLYINFEIQDCFFQRRVKSIATAKNYDLKESQFEHWGLRGFSASIDELKPKIINRIRDGRYALIVIDPIYKALGDRDENDAGDMNDLLTHVEHIAVATGAAIVFGAHFSKGNQAAKQSIDRISGSGVFGRDPDTILTMTQHREDGCFVVDSTLRNLPPCAPFVVRWQSPVFDVDQSLNAEDVKAPVNPAKIPKTVNEEAAKSCITSELKSKETICASIQVKCDCGVNRAKGILDDLIQSGFAVVVDVARPGVKAKKMVQLAEKVEPF